MAYTFSDTLYSDIHKDALGFRPGAAGYAAWNAMTADEKQRHWDYLVQTMENNCNDERKSEARRIAEIDVEINRLISSGSANDRGGAIRCIAERYPHSHGDVNFLEYLVGVPYGHFIKDVGHSL